ncbi:MAG: hypothetical protein WB816_09395 [Methylocystis sp.]
MVFSVIWLDALQHLWIAVHEANLMPPDEDRFKQQPESQVYQKRLRCSEWSVN